MVVKNVRKLCLIAVVAVCASAGVSQVMQPSFALTNAGSITALGTPLTESFDSLTASVTTWTDNATIPGWYSNRTAYVFGTGSGTAGALYSFGVTGTNPLADRALGSVASGTVNPVLQGARLTNNTGSIITSLDISYFGEQWRNGGNGAANTLTFQYQIANAGVITGVTAGLWTTFEALNFTGPVTTGTAAALDGNAPANRLLKSATLAVTVNPGQEIWVRWQDPDDTGGDHGLAIDDFSVTASGVPPPDEDVDPSITGTTPANASIDVAVDANIIVNFSESVSANSTAFTVTCGSTQSFTVGGSPGSVFTLNPDADLPYGSPCTVTVLASHIADADSNDPPDQMESDFAFSFTTADPPPPVATNVIIKLK